MTDSQSAEAKELALLGKVELRIALADGDDKVQNVLKTYLPPVLLKLASPNVSVRNKVISICTHVNTRIKPQTVKLPVAALVEQYKAHPNTPLIRHFDLLYIQHGARRMSASESEALFPDVVRGIAADSQSSAVHGSQLFNLLLQLLDHFDLPLRGTKEDQELRKTLQLSDEDTAYLAAWFGKLILFVPVKAAKGEASTAGLACPGLTPTEYSFLTSQSKDDVWNPASTQGLNLTSTKINAARLLASGIFTDEERFLPALFASADPASQISDVGDDMLKRVLPNTNLEDPNIVRQLLTYFFGEEGIEGRQRARVPSQLKIISLLTRSVASTAFSSEIVRMVHEGIADSGQGTGPDAMQIDRSSHNNNAAAGRETQKRRAALFSYINFVARYGSQDSLHAIAPQVLGRLKDFIENQGWPRPASYEDVVSRGYAYEVIGLLGKAGPQDLIAEPNLDVLRWLFTSLAQDITSKAVTVSIEEALSSILGAFAKDGLSEETRAALEDLLISQMEITTSTDDGHRSTKFVAVRFANRCLPYSSAKARWINLLAISLGSQDRQEVIEEGKRGLSPYWLQMLKGHMESTGDIVYPSFLDLMGLIFRSSSLDQDVAPQSLADRFRQSHQRAFADAIIYCRAMLLHECLKDSTFRIQVDTEWERKLNVAVESDKKTRAAVRNGLAERWTASEADSQALETLLYAFSLSLQSASGNEQSSSEASKLFVDLCALAPDALVARVAEQYHNFDQAIYSNAHGTRQTAAHAFGLLASHSSIQSKDSSGVQTCIGKYLERVQRWKGAIGAETNQVHGASLALAYYYSRCTLRSDEPVAASSEFTAYVSCIRDMILTSSNTQIKEAGFSAAGELCLYQVLSSVALGDSAALRSIVDRTEEVAKTGHEAAALALGHIGMILPEDQDGENAADDSILKRIEDCFHKLHDIKHAEAHFAIGEALSYLAAGWQSKALATKLDMDRPAPTGPPRQQTLSRLLERTLKDCANTKPSLRKASAIWLLCLVQFCGHLPEVKSRLAACQMAFKRCLTDRDELVQETASRGLGLVYENGDRALRDDLVRDLIGSFSDNQRGQSQLAGNVSEETQLFEPGALPTGDGSVTTYKDIMSLASEVGDSSLVYRFMSLASSNAIWSSRAAFGRFGLSNVLSDASADGYLASNPKLYPSLYRYRFDPNPGVQKSMNDIWAALVKDSSATIEEHFDAILEDLLVNIMAREWRTRQASCAAIADLVQGRQLERYEASLERIWNVCFKVMDDIKESVRAAAASLARTLTGILTRALEATSSSSKSAAAMLKHVLPFLLSTSGLESSATEVQGFALRTLLEIIKKSSGPTLRPFIPELVEKLLGLLSSLEPQAVNYIHLNADKYNLTEQKIDDMRLSSVRGSPLMEACERCLDLLDESTMQQLQPHIESAIKSAVGLPSKVGCTRVLVSLSTRHNVLFRPYADHFLRLVEKAVLDRNETVASSYAAAAGYVSRTASDKQILHLVTFAKRLYFASEGDRDQTVPRRSVSAGEIMHGISKHASDRFNSLAADLVPFVFVAKHDSNEAVKDLFQETWNDNVGGSRAVSLYLKEILDLSNDHLESPQWAVKHTCARAVADAVVAVASLNNNSSMELCSAKLLWPVIERATGGKTWEGKEVVLDAFVKFVECGRNLWSTETAVGQAVQKIALREAKRQNAGYRPQAVRGLGRIAAARTDLDMSDAMWDLLHPVFGETLGDSNDDDAMQVDGEGDKHALTESLLVGCVEALSMSINPDILHGGVLREKLLRVLNELLSVRSSSSKFRTVAAAVKSAVQKLRPALEKAGAHNDVALHKALADLEMSDGSLA